MTTSKIAEIKSVNPYEHSNGLTYYHNLVMENGDKINIGKNKEQLVGWEVTYEITGKKGEREFVKAKALKPEPKATNTFKPSNNGENQSILRQVAFKAVIELVNGGKLELHEIEEFTDRYHELIKLK